jgi:predicted nucleotidyltransferase
MSSEAGPSDGVMGEATPGDGARAAASDEPSEISLGTDPAGPESQTDPAGPEPADAGTGAAASAAAEATAPGVAARSAPAGLRSPYDEASGAKPYGEIPAMSAGERAVAADEASQAPQQVPAEHPGEVPERAASQPPATERLAPQAAAQPVGQPVGSLFEPVPGGDSGYLTDRPDVSQAVCTGHDVRRINLTALWPVAAAHPFPLVFSSVAGAHLYGFPSPDSDIDLRGVHLLPAVQVVGLRHGPQTVERTWLHDEVKLDLVTHDVGKFFRLMLRHNGYVLEQLLSPLVVATGPVHEELVAISEGCLTRGVAHHYRGFAHSQWELYQQTGQLKPLLYTFRVLLTGIHVIRTGQLVAHLPTLLELVPGCPRYLAELIEAKSAAEEGYAPELPPQVADDVVTLQAELDVAEDGSPLPYHPIAEGALHDLLVRLRLEGTSASPG